MSVIRIAVAQGTDIPTVVRAVRPATGASISQIKSQVEKGEPVYEAELFLNNFAEVADNMRGLIKKLQDFNVPFTIREGDYAITTEVLFNILARSEEYRI